MSLNQACDFTSWLPFRPILLQGLRWRHFKFRHVFDAYFVDEVSRLNRPAFGYLKPLKMHLLLHYLVTYLLPALPYVGTPPIHALVSYDAHCEVVSCHSMVLPAHYFWSYVC